ncbi:MAG TPA: metallophosphoesterase family protein [Gemmata sp.]|nr:metallophosphoesterase family protein [Gemmata sp.]
MRIGIVTDIHDEVAKLAAALSELQKRGVDAIVSLGDTSDLHGKCEDIAGVASALRSFGAIGVWGNHDYGLCRDISEETRLRFPAEVLEYMATMRPRLELGGCHFTHVEPWLDTENIEDLWCIEGDPEDPERLEKSFAAVQQRALFIGHFHRWTAISDKGKLEWNGGTRLTFEPDRRYLVIVGPLFRGDFAIIDTDQWILEPISLSAEECSP